MLNKSLISITDLNREEINSIFDLASKGKTIFSKYNNALKGKILGSIFFQSSTRTQFSFQSAFIRLGGNYIGCTDINQIRCGTPYFESMDDFAKILNYYCDIVVMRTQYTSEAYAFHKNLNIPFISAGNGTYEHPTQALTDLFIINKLFKNIDGQKILIIGTPRQRTINSLLLGLNMWENINIYFLCQDGIDLLPDIKNKINNIKVSFFYSWDALFDSGILSTISTIYIGEILYKNSQEYDYILTKQILDTKFSKYVQILSPLPRTTELSMCVDSHNGAKYFLQAQLGLYIRASLYLHYFI